VEQKGQVSPDGQWYWDSQKWVSTLSPDGKWRWDGQSWKASSRAPRMLRPSGGIRRLPGFRTGAAWKLPIVAVGALLVLAGIGSAVSAPPSNSAGTVAQAKLSPSPSADTIAISTSAPTFPPTTSPQASPSTTPKPSPKPTPVAAPKLPPAPPPSTCGAPANPWGYNLCSGQFIYSPPSNLCQYFNCIPSFWKSTLGYVDECRDGTYSHSGGRQGACSYHGGELRPLFRP